jgi:hypothetical protein
LNWNLSSVKEAAMDMQDNRNFMIAVLLNLLAVLLTISLYLAYQLFFEKGINNDLDRENLSLTRKIREYEEKAGKKPGTIIPIV